MFDDTLVSLWNAPINKIKLKNRLLGHKFCDYTVVQYQPILETVEMSLNSAKSFSSAFGNTFLSIKFNKIQLLCSSDIVVSLLCDDSAYTIYFWESGFH